MFTDNFSYVDTGEAVGKGENATYKVNISKVLDSDQYIVEYHKFLLDGSRDKTNVNVSNVKCRKVQA